MYAMIRLIILISICFISLLRAQTFKDSLLLLTEINVHFDNDKSVLDSNEIIRFDNYLDSLSKIRFDKIEISGHTDSKGSQEYNLSLSQQRMKFVEDYLLVKGMDSTQVESRFYGEEKLLLEEKDEMSRSMNRRVGIRMFKKMKFVLLKGKVVGDSLGSVDISILAENKVFKDSTLANNGVFEIFVPYNQVIKLTPYSHEFLGIPKMLKTNKTTILEPLSLNVFPVKSNQSIELKELNFYGDSPRLLPKSVSIANNLAMSFSLNPKVCFEIGGHVNAPFKAPDYSGGYYTLSLNRAKTIKKMFSRHIDSTRFYIIGYSNIHMKYPKATSEEEQAANRRVEITIKDCEEVRKVNSKL